MNQSLLITPRRRESNPLAFDKPTLLTLVVASLLLTETFSGALRYYFDMAGISWLLYLPKVACLIALGLELLRYRGWPAFWLVLLGLVTSSQLALMHGAELANIGFSLFIFALALLKRTRELHGDNSTDSISSVTEQPAPDWPASEHENAKIASEHAEPRL